MFMRLIVDRNNRTKGVSFVIVYDNKTEFPLNSRLLTPTVTTGPVCAQFLALKKGSEIIIHISRHIRHTTKSEHGTWHISFNIHLITILLPCCCCCCYYFLYAYPHTLTHTLQTFNTIFHLHFTSFLIIYTLETYSRLHIHTSIIVELCSQVIYTHTQEFEKRQKHVY